MQKVWQHLKFVAIILLLCLPLYFWFLINLYQETIQIPGEWKQYREQETTILNALDKFESENQYYPADLNQSQLISLENSIWQPKNWSFRYSTDENGEFYLLANVPKLWFGWETQRICRSHPDDSIECNFYYICYLKHGVQRLTEPLEQDQPGRPLFDRRDVFPCSTN